MTRYAKFLTPLGAVLATAEGGYVTSVNFIAANSAPPLGKDWEEDPHSSPLKECAEQLADYFAGARQRFDLPVAPRGTPFQERVWREIERVPFGQTITYSNRVARVRQACPRRRCCDRPQSDLDRSAVPSHRRRRRQLTGYAGGLRASELEIEGVLQERSFEVVVQEAGGRERPSTANTFTEPS
jgi:methylated-DNA-[protein]-cysteine S-methyltransferase